MEAITEEENPVPYREGSSVSPLEGPIVEALRTVFDPEIPVSIFDLGLIYDLAIDDAGAVKVTMTLTAPNCPVAEEIPKWAREAVAAVDGVTHAEVELVWDPFWKQDYMTEAARLMLGLM